MNTNFKHIEIFAGCGGMSLGLKAAGFDLHMANDLSPMAGETFAYNLFGENLELLATKKLKSEKVLWIKSQYAADNLKERLRENPNEYSKGKYSDLNSKVDLSGKLIIGNIDHLLHFITTNQRILNHLREQNVDLLSGGPPCQGFSLAGKRVKDDHKNILPLSFAKFAGLIQPKIVLLENVKGITSPFQTDDKVKHFAWLETAKAFSLEGFYPICMLVNSKYFGVPQNRPRFILLAFRKDVYTRFSRKANHSHKIKQILSNSSHFFHLVNTSSDNLDSITNSDINLYNIEKSYELFNGYLLPKIINNNKNYLKVSEAIGDISSIDNPYFLDSINNYYANKLTKTFKREFFLSSNQLQNHVNRRHNFNVKARFRLYQIFSNSNELKKDLTVILSGTNDRQDLLERVYSIVKDKEILFSIDNGTEVLKRPDDFLFFKKYIQQICSRKNSQRALKADEPAPAQMTIPDDFCHFLPSQLRTLTVREMARIQSFPDWFVFRSKITTGGNQRNFEIPQYTQVGNAVPPLLAYELGVTISGILNTI
jgi:DNA (cytosine-5)-methyltransferase 1